MAAPRPPSASNESLPDLLSSAFDFAKTFGQYEVAPQTFLQGNQRLTPGLLDGYEYSPQPGEMQDDAGRWYAPDGQLIQFVDGPALAGLLDLMPAVGSVVAPVKGAGAVLGAGPILKARPSEAVAVDPTVRDYVAGAFEASRKRTGTKITPETYGKVDNAMMKMSLNPSQNAYNAVDRAAELGFDTPMFHISGNQAQGRVGSRTPWVETDPHLGSPARGAVFTGNRPSAIAGSGAAVGTGGGDNAYVHGLMLRSPILGEHAMPSTLAANGPDQIPFLSSAPDAFTTDKGLADILAMMHASPYRQEAIDAWLSAHSQQAAALGQSFDPKYLMQSLDKADESVSKLLARNYFDPQAGGAAVGEDFIASPGGNYQIGVPGFNNYEAGARSPVWKHEVVDGRMQRTQTLPGIHSPMQTSMLGSGFTGSRIVDETRKAADGKTIAMHYMPAIRSVDAKFDPRRVNENNMLAGMVPPGWLSGLFQPQPDQQEPQL
jgi:hypothetical protein